MSKKRILTIVGARPQFIKAAAVSHAIRDGYAASIEEELLHTGQHYDDNMSANFFRELDIPQPHYNLGIGSRRHGEQTALMLKGIEQVLIDGNYDGVIVYGDTNSTLAGALAAAKMHIPVFHIEAGLRSFNRDMPEELNRVLTDHASALLFAPTQTAVDNLAREGFSQETVLFSGDVMLDNVLHYTPLALNNSKLKTQSPDFILATVHRDFNTDNPIRLNGIMAALNETAEQFGCEVLFPVHPRTAKRLSTMPKGTVSERVKMVEPMSYLETLAALKGSRLVMTDSGGLQKEAYFCGRPCVVLRPETEWVEIVDAGAAELADADSMKIAAATARLWNCTPQPPTQFGDGHAAERILKQIAAFF